jgi:hypothetical protein
MARKVCSDTFLYQFEDQLRALRDKDYAYTSLQLYVAGIPEPWEFVAEDEFEFHESTGVLVVRDGPTDETGHDNAEVPEYVFRLDAIVATRLV